MNMRKVEKHILNVSTFIMVAILPIGVLAHSALSLINNKLVSAASRTPQYLLSVWNLRRIAEMSVSVCSALFVIACIVMTWLTIKTDYIMRPLKIVLYFLIDVATMYACAFVFLMFGRAYWVSDADYLFPVWSNLIVLSLFFTILLLVNLVKLRRTDTDTCACDADE